MALYVECVLSQRVSLEIVRTLKCKFCCAGYNWEAAVSTAGKIKYQAKHYTMGRLAIELPYTMPDKKTVYITDDGDNVMLGLFVATKPGDMTCGSLYAGKFNQIGMGLYNGTRSLCTASHTMSSVNSPGVQPCTWPSASIHVHFLSSKPARAAYLTPLTQSDPPFEL